MAKAHETTKCRESSDSEEGKPQREESFEEHAHDNWLTVGELIRSIQKPISSHVKKIVIAFHEQLCIKLSSVSKCTSAEDCNKKKKADDLCVSCKCWLNELKEAHRQGNNPWWHQNCNSARWSEDPWEVAKFFMPKSGSNDHDNKKYDHDNKKYDHDNKKYDHDNRKNDHDNKKYDHDNKKYDHDNKKYDHDNRKDAESTDLSSLLNFLDWIKDDVYLEGAQRVDIELVRKLRSQVRNNWAHAPKQEFADKERNLSFSIASNFLNDLERKFPDVENRACKAYLGELEKDGITNIAKSQLNGMRELQQDLLNDNTITLPDKVPMFTARETEIKKVISFLIHERKAVVSLHGKSGSGKSAIASEMSHTLSKKYNILVVFSQLTTATSVDEMVRCLCRDVGVYYGDDPKSSLALWLKNITNKVIFVLDDIDVVLKRNSTLHGFVRLLRKNSNHHCQIVTTSRMPFEILDLTTGEVEVGKMDEDSCMTLLKRLCPEQEDEYLKSLANLCGEMPLALCMAASRVNDFADPSELLSYLENQPVQNLESTEYDGYVLRVINMSYSKCTGDERDTLLSLAIFEGSFSKEAAIAVSGHKKGESATTKSILEKLVTLLWIKKSSKHRYSIHKSLKEFLNDQGKIESEKRAGAEVSMVAYYLKLGHDLTLETYSKDGYKSNRNTLKQEEHHIQNVLNICSRQDASPVVLNCLAESEIYNTSARFFALLARTIISGSIVQNFLERCAQLAEERQQRAIKMNFDCLLAGQERSKSVGKSDEHFTSKMKKLQEEFEANKFQEEKSLRSLCAHYYYQQGRYQTREAENRKVQDEKRLDLQNKARKMMETSLELREEMIDKPEGKADMVFALLHVGNAYKKISETETSLQKTEESKLSSKQAQEHYEKAIQLSQDQLGKHELTASCHKSLGDLFLGEDELGMAEENYSKAKEMRESLGLKASKRHVFLLNNLGICLTKLKREKEAIEVLNTALEIANDLTENERQNYCRYKVTQSMASAFLDLDERSADM